MVAIGVDLGGTIIKIGLVRNEQIIDFASVEACPDADFTLSMARIESIVEGMIRRHDVTVLDGIAFGFAGQVDFYRQKIRATNGKYVSAEHIDLKKWVADKWHCRFFIDNDARIAAVGEWKYGAGRGFDNLVTMTIGTGIGTAVITEGRLIRGVHSQYGCLGGHITVNYNGRRCNCGNRGCVEAEAGSWSLPLIAKETDGYGTSAFSQAATQDFRTLFSLAEQGDRFSRSLRDHCMDVWSAAVVSYIHAYDPEVVIIGGGVMKSSHVILPYMQAKIDEHAWTPHGRVLLKAAEKCEHAAILGAVYCLIHNI